MKKKSLFYFSLLCLGLAVLSPWEMSSALPPVTPPSLAQPSMSRPAEWAIPVALDGVPNLYRVTGNVYRSAQPAPEGFSNLDKLGVKTVVSLRAVHPDRLEGTSLKRIEIKMNAGHPEEEDVVRAMRALMDDRGGPYLVHCMRGADRTGMIIAAYRMVVQGWSHEAAIDEMVNGGYGFNQGWIDILWYLEHLDVEKIRHLIAVQGQDNAGAERVVAPPKASRR
ncbi:MAG: tyrosine-protein phosphatase [Desulfobulbaceae bacterium]|jgi:protein tyrosine phosphatase (PTP) superfamily phosphohydrolase (DUF442 family)|nr:tyrosine-protein phosphatase [Desulfobulbaceae bacterium]